MIRNLSAAMPVDLGEERFDALVRSDDVTIERMRRDGADEGGHVRVWCAAAGRAAPWCRRVDG